MFYEYRDVICDDGKRYRVPKHLKEKSRAYRFWLYWQKKGFPVPDPKTGRCGFLRGELRAAPAMIASAAD